MTEALTPNTSQEKSGDVGISHLWRPCLDCGVLSTAPDDSHLFCSRENIYIPKVIAVWRYLNYIMYFTEANKFVGNIIIIYNLVVYRSKY